MTSATGLFAGRTWGELSIVIDRPDGTSIRWGGDELDAANVPNDLSFGTSMPGGFKGLSCSLLRDLGSQGREGLFDIVRVLGPGQEVVWEGRIQQMPASTEAGGRVNPQAVGWSSHLEDDATFREIYVDRETGSWGGRPLQRRISLTNASYKVSDGGVAWAAAGGNAVGPALDLTIPGTTWSTAVGRPDYGLTYQGGGVDIGSVEYRFFNPRELSSGWNLLLEGFLGADGDNVPAVNQLLWTGNAVQNNPGLRWTWSFVPGTRRVDTSLRCTAATSVEGDQNKTWGLYGAEVAVYGRHGLTGTRGRSFTGAGQGPYGYRMSDVLPDVLRRAAPLLKFSVGANGTIAPTDFAIPHLAFKEPTTAADVVQKTNAYHFWDWAVWENRTFWLKPRGTGRRWSIATADGLDLSLEGDTTDNIYNGVVVQYQDFAGVGHSIGPPGSIAEAQDGRLVSKDENNPATIHGLRRWGVLSLSAATDAEGAAVIGNAWLGSQATASRRGSANVYGTITDERGVAHPIHRIRAGDTLTVTDRPDDPDRRIVETNVNWAQRSNTLTLDSSAATLDAILERYGVSFTGTL